MILELDVDEARYLKGLLQNPTHLNREEDFREADLREQIWHKIKPTTSPFPPSKVELEVPDHLKSKVHNIFERQKVLVNNTDPDYQFSVSEQHKFSTLMMAFIEEFNQ